MADINNVFISGRTGADPNLRYYESGAVSCDISVGVNRWSKKKETEETTWLNCKIWGKKAEFVGEYVKKGDMVYISGSIQKDVYNGEDGNRHANTYILVEEIKSQSRKQQ